MLRDPVGEADFEAPTSFGAVILSSIENMGNMWVSTELLKLIEAPRGFRDSAAKRCIGRECAKLPSLMQLDAALKGSLS